MDKLIALMIISLEAVAFFNAMKGSKYLEALLGSVFLMKLKWLIGIMKNLFVQGVLPNVNFFPLNMHLFWRELFSFKYASVFIAALMVYWAQNKTVLELK